VTRRARAAALLGAAAHALASAVLARAQQNPPGLRFGSDVGVVRLDVTVVRPDGRFVTDLKETDFELLEDGKPQAVASFLRQELPVSLVLLMDASISVTDRMPLAREASKEFVSRLRPDDEVRLVSFNDRVNVLQELTSDREVLKTAIDGISAGGATALYNALYTTFRNLPAPFANGKLRRRVIVLVSDGEDTASLVWEEQVLELVRRREATVHVIALRAESDASNRSARLLRLLAAESGGEVHHPASIRDLDEVYTRIGDELRSQYTVGYVSSNPAQDGAWRRIDLRVRGRKDLQVRYRTGYYAIP
jgi:Ca-activated chloride channel family protein